MAVGILREAGGVYGARVVLLVGVGDNGGDALFAGALLARRGVRVDAVLLDASRVHVGGLAALVEAGGRVASDTSGAFAAEVCAAADLIVDGLLGIGGKGGLRERAAELALAADASSAPIVAVDLPSGVDADTGQVDGVTVRAGVTVTFGAYKPGLLIDPAAERAGVVEFVDIGLAPLLLPAQPLAEALQAADVAALLPVPAHETDKYGRGVVGLDVGSTRYPGAARLAVGGALRSGVGAVRYTGPIDVGQNYPEVMIGRDRVQAWVVGCGLDRDEAASARLEETLAATDVPVLVDADGLALLAALGPDALANRVAPTVLTPHAGEAARLLDVSRASVEARRLDSVRRLADMYGATVLLKGTTTLIASPGSGDAAQGMGTGTGTGTVRVNPTGTPVLATAGSGDVLAGVIGGLLAAGLRPLDAASVGAYLHGLAGRIAGSSGPIAAGDLLAALPRAWQNLQG
ncbi:MAG: NAD(P)H-hydrate dehydratase [Actinocrinis sp.]